MIGRTLVLGLLPFTVAVNGPLGSPASQKTAAPANTTVSALWEPPLNLPERNLFDGPWGRAHAPDPDAVYTYVRPKTGGTNPGVVVRDPLGREWHVKQPPETDQGEEGPVEVTLSRVLSSVGYHQPPVYFLPSFLLRHGPATHRETGGRFRLTSDTMRARGEWSWQKNPFVGMRPYQGLLVILLMFNSSDLKNSNNTLYDVRGPDQRVEPWYVVRDLGSALGESGHFRPRRNDPGLFEREKFITGVRNGFVRFSYHGGHQELIRERITPGDVEWATALLSALTDRQWNDAFRAGGYTPAMAERYIRKLHANIAQAQRIADGDPRLAFEGR
jgi:hypothetical protein